MKPSFSFRRLWLRRKARALDGCAERQLGKNDCGVSVVKTVLNLAGIARARHEIRDALPLDEEGSSFSDLKGYLERNGVACRYKVVELSSLDADYLAEVTPCVAMVQQGRYHHYVLIHGAAGDEVLVMDPAQGYFSVRPFSYLDANLVRISTAANEDLSYAFMESHIRRAAQERGIELAEALERETVVGHYNKFRYFEWLCGHARFPGQAEERAFLDELLSCPDDSIIPSRFKTFRLGADQLKVKTPVVLSLSFDDGAAARHDEAADPVKGLLKEIVRRPTLRGNLLQLLGLGAFVAMIGLIAAYANQILIDEVLPTREMATLYAFVGILLFFRLFELCQNVLKSLVEIRLAYSLDKWLNGAFNRAVVYASAEAISHYTRGELAQRVNDMLRIKGVVTSYLNDYLFNLVLTTVALLMTAYLDLRVAAVIAVVSGAYWLILRKSVTLVKALESRRFSEKGALVNSLLNLVEGHNVITKNRSEARFLEDQNRRLDQFLATQRQSMAASYLLAYIPRFIAILGSLLIVFLTTRSHIVAGDLSIGQIFTLVSLSEICFQSLRNILRTQLNLQEQSVVIDRFFDITRLEQRADFDPATAAVRRLELRRLSYHYPGRHFGLAIDRLSFAAGDRVLLEGGNGSGKSTLLKILSGLIRKGVEGDIVFYDREGDPLPQDGGFAKVNIIRAEDKVFNDTIQFNVSFNKSGGGGAIYKLARLVGADDFISPTQHPVDSIVHDHGGNLSTGQKRKLLILRALMSDADVLIFDEIFRGIDADSKRRIVETLNAVSPDKIVIYTTHEPMEDLRINRFIHIDNGGIRDMTAGEVRLEAA